MLRIKNKPKAKAVEKIYEDAPREHSSPCKSCAEKDHQLAEKDHQLAEKDQLVVELQRRIKELEAEKEKDPEEKTTGVIKQIVDTFEDAHYGTESEARRERELVKALPNFETFMGGNGIALAAQKKHQETYSAFVSFKKLIFVHYMQLFENTKSIDGDSVFAKTAQTGVLKIFCYLADVENESLGPNDCWLAGENAYTTKYGRPSVDIHSGGHLIAARLACQLIYGFSTLVGNIMNSHLCGHGDCIRPGHQFPEDLNYNQTRNKCHDSGCAATCTHLPRCIFQHKGKWMPCRNDSAKTKCDCELKKCFDIVKWKEKPKRVVKVKRANNENFVPMKGEFVDASFGTTKNGTPTLLFNDFRYTMNNASKKKKENASFRCANKNDCNGTAKTYDGNKVKEVNEHDDMCPQKIANQKKLAKRQKTGK